MRTVVCAMRSIVVAAVVYLTGIALALLAVIFGMYAFMAASGRLDIAGLAVVAELLLLLVPALATGIVVAQIRAFYRPLVSGAVGAAIALGAVCFLIGGASGLIRGPSGWELILYPVAAGSLAILGGLVGTRVRRRPIFSAVS